MKRILRILAISTMLTIIAICALIVIDYAFAIGMDLETILIFGFVIFVIVLFNVIEIE